jgi:hypothetical protein
MDLRYALAAFVKDMIDLALSPLGAGFFVIPLLTMRWIIRFMRWGIGVTRGGDNLEDMQQEYWNLREKSLSQRQQVRCRDSFRRRY